MTFAVNGQAHSPDEVYYLVAVSAQLFYNIFYMLHVINYGCKGEKTEHTVSALSEPLLSQFLYPEGQPACTNRRISPAACSSVRVDPFPLGV
jgi:hypothetical protein